MNRNLIDGEDREGTGNIVCEETEEGEKMARKSLLQTT